MGAIVAIEPNWGGLLNKLMVSYYFGRSYIATCKSKNFCY